MSWDYFKSHRLSTGHSCDQILWVLGRDADLIGQWVHVLVQTSLEESASIGPLLGLVEDVGQSFEKPRWFRRKECEP